jgi:hypothetical protein
MTCLHRTAVLSLLLLSAGCEVPPMGEATAANTHMLNSGPEVEEPDPDRLAGIGEPAITHGAVSRAQTEKLGVMLEAILATTLPVVARLREDLDAAAGQLAPPERLATNDSTLRTWGQAERDAYRAKVDLFYDEARRRLRGLEDAANIAAADQARTLAPTRAPLDTGATGDASLDTAVTTFAEVVDGAVGMRDVDVRHQQDRARQLDLFEVFSTFGARTALLVAPARVEPVAAADGAAVETVAAPQDDTESDAEAAMGGRILLFVGGDETLGAPRALLAFRADKGEPGGHHIAQVVRHRIMRGSSVVTDLGWRAAPTPGKPGLPQTEVLDNYLIAPRVEPAVDRTAPAFPELRDMRIVVDIQSAVLGPDNAVLGGVDWRIEFQVSLSGALTWQLAGGRPKFDPWCSEVKQVLGL